MNTATNYAEIFYSFSEINSDLLETNVKDFPASSVAQFLLLYHKKKNNDPTFEDSLKKIGTYSNNPFWIQYQLLQTSDLSNQFDPSENKITPLHFAQPEITEDTHSILPNSDDALSENKIIDEENRANAGDKGEEEIKTISEETNSYSTFIDDQKENIEFQQTVTETQDFSASEPEEKWDQEVSLTSKISAVTDTPIEKISEEIINSNYNEEPEEVSNNLSEEKNSSPVFEEKIQDTGESLQSISETENFPVSQDEQQLEKDHEYPAEILEKNENEPASIAQQSYTDIESRQENITENKTEGQAHDDSISSEINDTAIEFEPLHTVDYFASQGIKISEEALENDQLGKQVKSFTAWLKSMKKLHPGQLPEQNEVIEKIIQSSSEASNNEANILTEAMAEVLVMQNKKEKAIEMYQKLSLLNPSKSAYFAAKIESLKTT